MENKQLRVRTLFRTTNAETKTFFEKRRKDFKFDVSYFRLLRTLFLLWLNDEIQVFEEDIELYAPDGRVTRWEE
jgi:hypothetical protein